MCGKVGDGLGVAEDDDAWSTGGWLALPQCLITFISLMFSLTLFLFYALPHLGDGCHGLSNGAVAEVHAVVMEVVLCRQLGFPIQLSNSIFD